MPALSEAEEHTGASSSSPVSLSLPAAPVAAAPTTSSLLRAISSPAMVASPPRRLALGGGATRVATPGSVRKVAPMPSAVDAADEDTENAHPNAPRSPLAAATTATTGKSPARVSSKAKADPSAAHRIAKRQEAANKRDKERRAAAAAMRAR